MADRPQGKQYAKHDVTSEVTLRAAALCRKCDEAGNTGNGYGLKLIDVDNDIFEHEVCYEGPTEEELYDDWYDEEEDDLPR